MNKLISQESPMFQRAITIFRPSRAVLNQANNLLRLFLEHEQVQLEVRSCMAEIATFIAQSSQEIRDLKGRKISGMGLTFSRLIGNCVSIPQLMLRINRFINVVHLEPQYKTQIQNYIAKAKSTYEFMQLFQSYINKLELVSAEYIGNLKYKDIFIELAWVLYIDSRESCIKADIDTKQENNCLLASVFYCMIRYSLEYLYPKDLKIDRNAEKRVIIVKILEFLLNKFDIKQIELYMKVADKFDEYVQRLISSQVLKSVGSETDFFSPIIIHLNYKQIQNKYQKRLQPKDIDFRVFRKEKCLTPIHRQALFHRAGIKKFPALSKSMTTEYRSHRALNYEEIQSPKSPISPRHFKCKANPEIPPGVVQVRNNPELHIRKNANCLRLNHSTSSLIFKPSPSIPQGIDSDFYRYVNTLTKASKNSHKSLFYEKSLQIIQQFLSKLELNNLEVNKKSLFFTIYSIYVSFAQKIFNCQQETTSLHKSLISMSLFIGIKMHQCIDYQQTIISISKDIGEVQLIDLWYCMNYFILHCQNIPKKLITIYDGEKEKIMCTQIWKNNAYIDQIAQLAANYEKDTKFVTFSEKMIEYCQNFLKEMTDELQISEEHCIYAYNCIKFILSANGNILENQNIDRILMCCLYIAGKTLNSPILFANIKEAYQILYVNKNRDLQQIFNKVTVNSKGFGDIIYFYNKFFLENIKPFVPYMANPSLSLLHPIFQREISFQSQNYPVNMINIMQTTKPKNKKLRHKTTTSEAKSQGLGIIIQGDRNQTRVRIRPHNSMKTQLSETEKIKKLIDSQQEENYE